MATKNEQTSNNDNDLNKEKEEDPSASARSPDPFDESVDHERTESLDCSRRIESSETTNKPEED